MILSRRLAAVLPALAVLGMLALGTQQARADISLGQAANYAVLGIGESSASAPGAPAGFEIYQSATVVNGNVGVGPNSIWTHGMDATINGRVDDDTTVSPPTVTGTITGGVHSVNMAPVVADALAADSAAAALAPTQTFSTLTSGQTISSTTELNVIRVTGDVSLSGGSTTLTIHGSATDEFVIQLTASDATSAHTLNLSGVTMSLTGGITPDRIFWDMSGVGGGITITSGATVYGTFLAPDRSILVDQGTVDGRVIGGGGADSHSDTVSIHSSSQVASPATAVPEPSTLVAAGLGALGFIGYGLRRRSKARS